MYGDAGDDDLSGGSGVDRLSGGDGNDWLKAGSGDDRLYGDSGDDVLDGGAGNDQLSGGAGADALLGGQGNDVLSGSDGDDVLFGGDGVDTLRGGDGNDLLRGDSGDGDILYGDRGNDVYLFGLGDGTTYIRNTDPGDGHDVLRLLEGITPDAVTPVRSGDALSLGMSASGETVWILEYFAGDVVDVIKFADGRSWSENDVRQMLIAPTDGDDQLVGYESGDLIVGGAGNDQIHGEGGDDRLSGGTGDDRLYGGAGNDHLNGDLGNDQLFGEAGDDVLVASAGQDVLSGGAGNDTYAVSMLSGAVSINNLHVLDGSRDRILFESGIRPEDVSLSRQSNDLVIRLSGSSAEVTVGRFFLDPRYAVDSLQFADGQQLSSEEIRKLLLSGGNGDDRIVGYGSDDQLYGFAGNDFLQGGSGDDSLFGGSGDDNLVGSSGHDRLIGGEGDDWLTGGDGHDLLHAGPGGDDQAEGGAGNDTYLFGRGDGNLRIINLDEDPGRHDVLEFTGDIQPTEVSIGRDGHDLLLVLDASGETVTVDRFFLNEKFRLDRVVFPDGSAWTYDDLLAAVSVVTEGDDLLFGTDEPDVIESLAGNDEIHGGAGDDLLSGGPGHNRIYGGEGNDYLEGSGRLYGGDGNDTLRAVGGVADPTYLVGGTGSDIFEFSPGDGNLVISSDPGDTLRLSGGILQSDVTWSRVIDSYWSAGGITNNTLEITIGSTGENLQIPGFFDDIWGSLETIVFSDGTALSAREIQGLLTEGSAGDDVLYNIADESRREFAWTFIAGLSGGDGRDRLYGSALTDLLQGGAGDDFLLGDDGADVLYGDEGRDDLEGGDGNDFLSAGSGEGDFAHGGRGNDVFYYRPGESDLHLKVQRGFGNEHEVLFLGPEAQPGTTGLARSDTNLKITFAVDADRVMVLQHFNSDENRLDAILFAQGTVWTAAYMDALMNGTIGQLPILEGLSADDVLEGTDAGEYLLGNAGNDLLQGGAGDDYLEGGEGVDILEGGDGNDFLRGGPGDGDVLSGGKGVDTYLFARGDGNIEIQGTAGAAGIDRLVFLDGVNDADVTIQRNGDDLLLTMAPYGEVVTVRQFFLGGIHQLESVQFSNGVVWSKQFLHDTAGASQGDDRLTGGQGDDVLSGLSGDDRLLGNAGDDRLFGDAGEDHLYGGAGNDQLFGGEGADYLSGGRGDDLLNGGPGDGDVLIGGPGRNVFEYARSYGDTTIISSGQDVLKFVDDTIAADLVLERGQDGDLIIRFLDSAGTITVDYHFGSLLHGVREILFPDGSRLTAADIALNLGGTTQDDRIAGGMTDDDIDGRQGNDWIEGGPGQDTLFGGPGNDVLQGGADDDDLHGGPGNDLLIGGEGDDRYHISLGDGATTISNQDAASTSVDQLVFAQGIAPGDIQLQRIGDSLLLHIGDSGEEVMVSGFYADESYRIDSVVFADGTLWSRQDLIDMAVSSHSNYLPEVSIPLFNQVVAEDEAFEYRIPVGSFTDADGDTLSYSATLADGSPLPGWLSFDPATGRFSGTPDDAAVGELLVRVTASDGQASAHDDFLLTVTNRNDAPQLVQTLPDLQVVENEAFEYRIPIGSFTDADGDALSYSATLADGSPLPGWLSFDPATGRFSGTPGDAAVGELLVRVTATDGQAIAHDDFLLTVTNRNDAPQLVQTLPDLQVVEDEAFEYRIPIGTFTDADGDALSYSATLADGSPLPGWLDFDPATGRFSGTPGETEVGQYSILVEASDGEFFASGNYTLTVGNLLAGGNGDDRIQGGAASDVLLGLEGDDLLWGGRGTDFMLGGAGTDRLLGGAGNDVLNGGTGDADRFYGGPGSDRYVFHRGDGNDVIYNFDIFRGDQDVLELEGFGLEDLSFSRDGKDLLIRTDEAGDSVRIRNWYFHPWFRLDAIQTDSGVILQDQVERLVMSMSSFDVDTGGQGHLDWQEHGAEVHSAWLAVRPDWSGHGDMLK